MALRGEPRAALAVQLLELVVAVVERVREMRRGAARLAAADRTVVDDHDAPAALREAVGGGEPGDPGADDADVGLEIALERRGSSRSAVAIQTDFVQPESVRAFAHARRVEFVVCALVAIFSPRFGVRTPIETAARTVPAR